MLVQKTFRTVVFQENKCMNKLYYVNKSFLEENICFQAYFGRLLDFSPRHRPRTQEGGGIHVAY